MKPAERLKIPPTPMPEQDPGERIHNVKEVPLGYTPEMAMLEASRCLQCKTPFCVEGCPVGIDIPGFIGAIEEGDFKKGVRILKQRNLLPAVCGRVCPQEEQCQQVCTIGKARKDPCKAVMIGKLERSWRTGKESKRPGDTSPGNEDQQEGGGNWRRPGGAHRGGRSDKAGP